MGFLEKKLEDIQKLVKKIKIAFCFHWVTVDSLLVREAFIRVSFIFENEFAFEYEKNQWPAILYCVEKT